MYTSEADLVQDLQTHLITGSDSFSRIVNLGCEFRYESGSVDVIASTEENDLISFEAKLANWRIALQQAYRRSSFCHFSYVAMPESVAKRIQRHWCEFESRNVGLCSVTPASISIVIPANRQIPFQPWLTDSAVEYMCITSDSDIF